MHTTFTNTRPMAGLRLAALLLAFLPATLASATGHLLTSTVDPTPATPGSGDEITVTFNSADTAQGRADNATVKAAFDAAVAGSADMKSKVVEAGNGHGRALTYNVKRDDPNVTVAEVAHDSGVIDLDVGDIGAMGPRFSGGTAANRMTAADNMLTDVLAHETEHAKDDADDVDDNGAAPGNDEVDHRDPEGWAGTMTGPAVDDANMVHAQLGTGVKRDQYCLAAGGNVGTTFTIGGNTVTFDLRGFVNDRRKVNRFITPPQEFNVDPNPLQQLPQEPCEPGGTAPCWDPACGPGTPDGDCDTVGPDDNCPTISNPEQADYDGDGVGAACQFAPAVPGHRAVGLLVLVLALLAGLAYVGWLRPR